MFLFASIRRTFPILIVFLVAFAAQAQTPSTARTLLNSMIEALGGRAFLNANEIQANGRFFSFAKGELVASDLYADYIKFPDMERTEFGKEKEKKIEINRGKEGWNITPPSKGKGNPDVQPKTAAEVAEFLENFKTSFDYVIRFVINSPKTSIISTGSQLVEYKRTDILEIRDAEKNLMRVFIDRDSRLPVKTQVRKADDSIVHEETYANWHRIDSVMTPLLVVRFKGGVKTMEIRAEKVSYDPGFPDSLFAPPVPASK